MCHDNKGDRIKKKFVCLLNSNISDNYCLEVQYCGEKLIWLQIATLVANLTTRHVDRWRLERKPVFKKVHPLDLANVALNSLFSGDPSDKRSN